MNLKYMYLLLLPILLAASCNREMNCESTETLIIKDFSGLDACKWLLERTDGSRLEPLNLDDFISGYEDGTVIKASFKFEEDFASACQAGRIIRLNCVEK